MNTADTYVRARIDSVKALMAVFDVAPHDLAG